MGWRRALLLDLRCRRADLDADALGRATGTAGPACRWNSSIKRQTSETADFFGFDDRGRLAPGKKADVNVIDYEGLRLHKPEVRYDLPAGGRRLMQRVDGYKATLVSGAPVFEHGEYTGALPGKLVRAGR